MKKTRVMVLFLFFFAVAHGQRITSVGELDFHSGDGVPTMACRNGDTYDQTDATSDYSWRCIKGSWKRQASAGAVGGIPVGAILLIVSGTCPSGFIEETSLNGKTLFGTLAVNANVGMVGGADSITPAGTVAAPVFTGSVLATHTHTFTGIPLLSHGHTFTGVALSSHSHTFTGIVPTSHTHTFTGIALANHAHELPFQLVANNSIRHLASTIFGTGTSRAAQGGLSPAANTTSAVVALSQAVSSGTPAGTISSTVDATPAGSNSTDSAGIPAGTNASVTAGTPVGSNSSDSSGTPSGTNNAPAFIGTTFDNRSAFMNVIFCRKT